MTFMSVSSVKKGDTVRCRERIYLNEGYFNKWSIFQVSRVNAHGRIELYDPIEDSQVMGDWPMAMFQHVDS